MAHIEPNDAYNLALPRWQKVRDIIDGEDRLKQVDLARIGRGGYSTTSSASSLNGYLRLINTSDKTPYNLDLNEGYIKGARLFNTTERTLSGMMGMLFRNEPAQPDNFPASLDYIFDNVDGSGHSMAQQARSVSSDVVQIGRDGLLVDMPMGKGGEVTKLTFRQALELAYMNTKLNPYSTGMRVW